MRLCFTFQMLRKDKFDTNYEQNDIYHQVATVGMKQEDLDWGTKITTRSPFFYDFEDGYRAKIEVQEISGNEANRISKGSNRFGGCNWMIKSIIKNARIVG